MKLVVIGNGFDCAHGLNTKYASFREFIKKSDADEYNFLKQLFGANFEMDEFWYNFEESLARYNLNNFVQDLEKITLNNKIKHFDDAKCEEIIKNSFKEYIYKLKKLFCLWIKKINDEDLKNIKKKDNISKYLENSIILTFNYTSIIEDLYKKTCYHMHGCIKDLNLDKESELGNIILGHSYEI